MLKIEIDEIDSMFDVLTLFVEKIEKNKTTIIDWLNWDEKIKMIIEFNSRICHFVEDLIDSKINHFADLFEISTRNDSSRFFNLNDKQNMMNNFIETQHSINVIFLVFYEHDRKRFWNHFFLFRDRFSFHNVIDCFNSTKINESKLFFHVDFIKSN